MELKEILKILGNMTEKEFLTLSKEEWRDRIQAGNINNSAQIEELLAYSSKHARTTLFVNTLAENCTPRSLDPQKPVMDFKKMCGFLGINTEKSANFLTMSSHEWEERVKDSIQNWRYSNNRSYKRDQDDNRRAETEAEINKHEVFLLNLKEINARKQFFVQQQPKYEHLQTITPERPAYEAAKKEGSPTPALTSQGNSSSLYTIKGDTPEEIAKNKKAIFEKHTNTLKNYYNSGKMTDEEKKKYPTETEFLAAFKPQEDVYFKDFAALEKSEVADECKEQFKNQQDKFPMTLTILPFPDPKAKGQGMDFMDEIAKAGHIKPLPPAAKEEKKEKEEEKTTPGTGP